MIRISRSNCSGNNVLVSNKMLASTASGGGGAELGQFGDRLPRRRPQLAFLCTYSSSIPTGSALPSSIMSFDTIHESDIVTCQMTVLHSTRENCIRKSEAH